jgi:hypothetical protein
MDMVGGDAEITKAVFHVTRSPASLPTFVNDVGEVFGRFVNEQTYAFAATGRAAYPLVDPEGSKRALQAEMSIYSEGSDHQVWTEGSWRVPAIYLNDWPDRYIHTHADGVANIDATKLLRAGFIGAASAYYLATLDSKRTPALWEEVRRNSLRRAAEALARRDRLVGQPQAELDNVLRFQLAYERGVLESIAVFGPVPSADAHLAALQTLMGGVEEKAPTDSGIVYRRAAEPKGPMDGFGYSWFRERTEQAGIAAPALLRREPLWSEASYDYEALNLVDGRRTVRQIRDALSAIYGPVPIEEVAEYLDVLRQIKVLEPAEARTPSAAAD